MAIVKNAGYVEDLADNATQGQIDAVKREASAIKVSAQETNAYVEGEVAKEQGAANEAKYNEAGAQQARATPEGEVASELIGQVAPSVGIAANLIEGLGAVKSNPSKGADIAKAKGKMGAAIVGEGAKSFEDSFSSMKKESSITTAKGRSLFEKNGALSASIKSLRKETTGIQENGSATAKLKVGEIKTALDLTKGLANEAKLNRAIALEKTAAPAGPGGMGSGAPGLRHDSLAHGPKRPTHMDEESEQYV